MPELPGTSGEAGASAPAVSALLGAALAYAAKGWAVFPVAGIRDDGTCRCAASSCDHPGKHPVTRHGLHDASRNPAEISAWWSLHPWANVAIATGQLVVIDIDPDAGGWDSLGALIDNGFALPPTATVITGGGGAHFYYLAPQGECLRNTAGRLPGVGRPLPGIDLRGAGGYVIAPPSRHATGQLYRSVPGSGEAAPAPEWLHQPPPVPARPVPSARPASATSAYGQAAVREELALVRAAAPGTRNHALNRAAFALGQLAAGGEVLLEDAVNLLFDAACGVGLSEVESRRTIESGIRAGQRWPRRRRDNWPRAQVGRMR